MSVSSAGHETAPVSGHLLDTAADAARNALQHTLHRAGPDSAGVDMAAAPDVLGSLEKLQALTGKSPPPAAPEPPADAGPLKPLLRLTLALRASAAAERRNTPRFPHVMPCIVTFDGQDHATETLDIGRRGILAKRPDAADIHPGLRARVCFGTIGAVNMRVTGVNAQSVNLVAAGRLGSVAEAALNGLILRLRNENDYQAGQVRMLAATVTSAFEAGLTQNRIKPGDLFDEDYRPVAGSDPQQFTTRATPFHDAVLPDILARMFEPKSGMVYAVITDRNGHVPVHNRPYSQPQRPGDRAFNLGHARQRRIYDDSVTLRAARFAREVVIQTYLRDIAAGPDLYVKDIAAPIFIRGRRWGCAQVAYSLTGA